MSKRLQFDTLPSHLLISTFKKLPNIPLCRLRQTCSFMNNFIESNQKELSSRPGLVFGCSNRYCSYSGDQSPGIFFILKKKERGSVCISYGNDFEADICQKLSAVAINEIHIFFDHLSPVAELEKILKVIRRLRPTCDSALLCDLPSAVLIELADLIDCRGRISVRLRDADFNHDNLASLVNALKLHPKHLNFQICMNDLEKCRLDELFGLLKPFREALAVDCTSGSFHQLLLEIVNSPDVGNLRKLTFQMEGLALEGGAFPPPLSAEVNIEIPSYSLLWALDLIETRFHSINLQRRNPPFAWWTPDAIRLIHLPTKYAVIVEYTEGYFLVQDIHFVEKDEAEVVKVVIHALRIGTAGEEFIEQYLVANEERRKELLEKEFVNSFTTDRMRLDGLR